MSPTLRRALLVVEGPHDQAFLRRLLELSGYSRWSGRAEELLRSWSEWQGWIPTWPRAGDYHQPVGVPELLKSPDCSVCVVAAGGGNLFCEQGPSGFKLRLKNQWPVLSDLLRPGALAFFVDADEKPPDDQAGRIAKLYSDLLGGLPSQAGAVARSPSEEGGGGGLDLGTFVLPDNTRAGALEVLLLAVGQHTYADLLQTSGEFTQKAQEQLRRSVTDADKRKATVAAAVSQLRPGVANAVSIRQDQWLTRDGLESQELAALMTFLRELGVLSGPVMPPA